MGLSKIVADLRAEGWSISEEDLSFLSPYLTSGVKRFGEYGLDFDRDLEPTLQDILSAPALRRQPIRRH
jgi:hypothetical protein